MKPYVKPTTREEFLALENIWRLRALQEVLEESAQRCSENILFKDTWVEDTFSSVSSDLRRIWDMMAMLQSYEDNIKAIQGKAALQPSPPPRRPGIKIKR